MMNSNERRKGEPRVQFEPPLDVRVMTIDGTWSGESGLIEISDNDARLKVTGHASVTDRFLSYSERFRPSGFPSLQESVGRGPADRRQL